jgi:hypothetical protein
LILFALKGPPPPDEMLLTTSYGLALKNLDKLAADPSKQPVLQALVDICLLLPNLPCSRLIPLSGCTGGGLISRSSLSELRDLHIIDWCGEERGVVRAHAAVMELVATAHGSKR